MKRGIFYKASLVLVPFLVSVILRLWFATCRITEHGSGNLETALDSKKSVIALFWHYSLVYVFYHLKKYPAAVLVSASEDGEYIARLAHCLNFSTVRGSSNRRGLLALKELMLRLEQGEHVGMVADGSQGPQFILQAGSILLASKTGAPIVPMAWSASRFFTFRSWDRTCIPMPFSRIDYYCGEPFSIPPGLDREAIEYFRLQVEEALNQLYQTAWSTHRRKAHYDEISI
jgi:lysophospholipid acyltransferase (LPLAT)-like uncharacterized protein